MSLSTRRISFLPGRVAAFAFAALGVFALLPGCGKNKKAEGAAAPQPLEVSVITVKPETVTLTRELPGRTSAFRVAEVRARINGIVQKRLFTEGTDVKEGDVLFEIDPAPYQAVLDSAKATLARAEASLASAQAQADRFKDLVATHAVAKQTYDDAVATALALNADVAAGKAAVRSAEINLGYTRVTAPISGRIGRAEVTEGAYVQQGTATLLATIQQLDPLYVDLSQSADQVLSLKEALASGRLQRSSEGNARLQIILPDGKTYSEDGSLEFSDVSVNTATGTVMLRGTIPNPGIGLLPGMFVRARLAEGSDANAILLPQSVVSRNAKGEATAMLVGADNKVETRTLQTSRTVGNRWFVTGGLKPGDRVIADNLQKIRPGMSVKPVPAAETAAPSNAATPVSSGETK
ncbi:MAG TPA: efflux RND transporter periplasmic adaptor subunit [Opitutaceae bacterium]|nr:efflux RND transporter periplasmic adaptor subunit [Opitutaceae bacterium]